MNRSRCVPVVFVILLAAFGIAGCDNKPQAETSSEAGTKTETASEAKPAGKVSAQNVLGKYENAHDKITIELKADGKATMTDEGKSTDVTWEMDGADKLVVHGQEGMNLLLKINPDGSLSDNMGLGSVFRKK